MKEETGFKRDTGGRSTAFVNSSSERVPEATSTVAKTTSSVPSADSTETLDINAKIQAATKTAVENQTTSNQLGFFDSAKYFLSNLPFIMQHNPAFGPLNNIGRLLNFTGNSATTITNVVASTGEFLSEPAEGIPIQKEINWVNVLETIDDLFVPKGTSFSVLDKAGYTKPFISSIDVIAKKIGYQFDSMFKDTNLTDTELSKAVADYEQRYQIDLNEQQRSILRRDLIRKKQQSVRDERDSAFSEFYKARQMGLNILQSEMEKRPNTTNLMENPYYAKVVRGLEAMKDGKPSWFLSKGFHELGKGSQWVKEYIGPTETGNEAADWLVNGVNELVSSVVGSVLTGKALGAGFGLAGKMETLAKYPKIAKAYEKMAQTSMAIINTSGESFMEGDNAAKTYRDERLSQIGGEEMSAAIEERTKKLIDDKVNSSERPDLYLMSENERRYLERTAKEQVFEEFMTANPQYRDEIDKGMAKAFDVTVKVNALNIAFNWFSSGLYLRGKFPTRNILANPEKIGFFGKDAFKAGKNEFMEESINQVANKAGVAAGKGEYYDIGTNVFAMDVLESGFWGFLGGHGETMLTNYTSYNSRLKDYNAQQKFIAQQNKIGSATQANIDRVMGLDSSYEGLMKDQALMNALLEQAENETDDNKKKELHEAASMVSDRMATTQTIHANESGTVENLLKNYKQVADNEDLLPEVREEAKKVIQKILSYEKVYNETRKYENANDVFYTRTGIKLVQEASSKTKGELIDLQNQLLEEQSKNKEAGLTEPTVAEKDLQEEITKKKAKFEGIQTALEKFKVHEKNLTSREQQISEKNSKKFFRDAIELKSKFQTEAAKNGEEFNVFESQEYNDALEKLIAKYENGLINEEGIKEIKKYQAEKKEGWEVYKKNVQRETINAATNIQLKLANETLQGEVTPENNAAATAAVDELSSKVKTGEVNDEYLDWGSDPKMVPTDPTEEQKGLYERVARAFYNATSDLIENPTIEDVVRFYGKKRGMMEAEKALDALVQGWKIAKLPGYETLDTMKVFNKMFTNIDSLAEELNNHLNSYPQTAQTTEEIQEAEKQDREKEAESVYKENQSTKELDKNGAEVVPTTTSETAPIEADVSKPNQKLDVPSATISHKSMKAVQQEDGSYKLIDTDLNQGEYAPHMMKLLFNDHNNVGTIYTAMIPSDFMDRNVKIFDKKGLPLGYMKFGEWVAKNNINPDSQEYRNKIPMVLIDSDGDAIGMLHDIDRITTDKHTFETVDSAKEATIKIRNAVIAKKQVKVKVNRKYLGHPIGYYKEGQEPFLSQADPNSSLAIAMSGGLEYDKIALNITNPEEQIINAKHALAINKNGKRINLGALYELRRVGVTESGKPKYFALRTNAPKTISQDIQNGIVEVIMQFISRKNEGSRAKYTELMKELFRITHGEIDMRMFNESDAYNLDKYLSQFITVAPVMEGETEEKKINKTIEEIVSRKELGSEDSYFIFTVNGKVVIGKAYAGNSKSSIDDAVKSDNPLFASTLKEMVGKFRPNVSKDMMRSPSPVMLLVNGKWTKKADNYTAYLKNTHTTSNVAKEVTETFKDKSGNLVKETTYVTYLQPTMGIEMVEDTDMKKDEYSEAIEKNELSDALAEKIAQKQFEKKELTPQEQQVALINPKKIEELLAKKTKVVDDSGKLYPWKGRNLTMAEIKEELAKEKESFGYTKTYIDEKKKDDDSVLFGDKGSDPVILTKEERRRLQESQHTIDKLFQVHQRNIVEFIFNNVSVIAKTENGKIKNISDIKKYIRSTFNNYMENNRLYTIEVIKEKQALIQQFGVDLFPDALEIIERAQQNLELINIVTKNWKVFEEEAILMSKKFNDIENKKTNAEPDGEIEGEEPTYEDGEDRNTPSFSRTAEEVNHKERVSAEVRVFCQGIERKDASGQTVTGIFGIPLYVGYDTVFDTVSALLADMPSDTAYMKEMLENHRGSHRWMVDFINKLFPEDKSKENKSLQNEVVRHMTKHALDMEFVMFQKNRNGTYALKIYSTNSTAIIQNLKQRWESTINTSKLFDIIDGEYVFNLDKIDEVLREYEALKGNERKTIIPTNTKDFIISAINDYTASQRDKESNEDKKKKISTKTFFENFITGQNETVPVSTEAMAHISNAMARAGEGVMLTFEFGGNMYVVEKNGQSNSIVIRPYQSPKPTKEALMLWLKNFGIEISDKTARQIIDKKFIYDSKHKIAFNDQWIGDKTGETYSLLGALAGTLNQIRNKVISAAGEGKHVVYTEDAVKGEPYTGKLLRQTVIDSLAKMEAKHTEHRIVSSFYDNKKVLYGYTVTKYITDRINDLKGQRKGVEDNLRRTTYNKNAFWLDMMTYDDNFYDTLLVKHLGITALKEQGKKIYRNNALQELSLIDHELTKLGMFMSMQQGDVNFQNAEAREKYKGFGFRVARMFSPTMSDKSTSTIIRTNVLNYDAVADAHIDQVLEFAFSQLVMPDLTRMVQHKNMIKSTNVKAYDDGAELFYFLPRLNNMNISIGGVPIDFNILIEGKSVKEVLNTAIDGDLTVKQLMTKELLNYMESEAAAKLQQWEKAGFLTKDEKNVYTGYKFLDYTYMTSRDRSGTIDSRARLAAMDYTLNSMIANANSFMMIAGDPAQFFKKASGEMATAQDHVEATFSNITKRLASQIAPGDKIADSDVAGNEYIQLQLQDVFRISDNIKMIVKANDNKDISDEEIEKIKTRIQNNDPNIFTELDKKYPNSTGKLSFFNIESTNAQEYTTWREHLYILEKLGKTPNYSTDITQEDIDAAREIFTDGTKWENLTPRQKSIVGRIVQPMKPVYTEQIYDEKADLMRFVYIKSSSFPLIPQLTAGMELDKVRQAMENMESHESNTNKKTVRASFYSANKVGSVSNALQISDIDGNFIPIHQLPNEILMKSSLVLPRSGFRIQQNVPYKSALTQEDVTTLGTQTTKLLFGNGVMGMNGFNYHGEKSGTQLQQEFFKLFDQLVEKAKNDLFRELGMDPVTYVTSVSPQVFYTRISNILKKEAILRGFPKQDIKALGINPKTGQFEIPLWMSPNSQKFEALLTSIISHRISKIKFPGYSYVAGSENGFKVRTDEEFDVDKNGSQMVFTDAWNGSALKPNQAFVQSKFRVNGKLVDLLKDGYAKKVDGKWMLDTDRIDTDLLEIPSFRIPTSKHSSMEKIEIAGFLPASSADLIIVSRDGTVAMGEDYDIDKRYTYHLWTTVNKDGKIIPLDKKEGYQIEGKSPIKVIDELIAENNTLIQTLNDKLENKDLRAKIEDKFNEINEADNAGEDITELREELNQLINDLKVGTDIDIVSVKDELGKAYDKRRELDKDKSKLLQNEIIKIHNVVFSHPDVKKLMVQKLSVDEAKKNAEFIDGLTQKKEKYSTPISDRYQQDKLVTGAVGRRGTAAYSLDVVGHSLFEQAHWNGNTLRLIGNDEEGKPTNLRIRFGRVLSDGKLGQQTTLSEGDGETVSRNGDRNISDIHSERQNLMVDNATEEIAAKVHLNNYTMTVDKILNMLGFDKGNDGHSISFLFISQPIIKKYVEMMESRNSNTAEYEENRREKIIAELLGDYANDTTDPNVYDAMMDNTTFTEEIIKGETNSAFQAAVLKKFIELEKYGRYLTSIQTAINVDSKGVGKNLFEVTEKLNAIQRLFVKPESNEIKKLGYIDNVSALIGDYFIAESTDERNRMLEKGWIQVQKVITEKSLEPNYHLIKPNTVAGTYAIHSLVSADTLWNKFFPYNNDSIIKTFSQITKLIGNSDLSESKTIEIKKMIFDEMKKYLVTNRNLDYFTLSPQEERKRLFFDAKKGSKSTQQSLASFIKGIMDNKDSALNPIKSNRLLNRLEFELNMNGKPSLIKLLNGIGQNFDETYIYDSIIELIDENIPLGKFNGKDYTSTDLAQDLVLYAYMEGGVQQAIQFVKYIPVSYLKIINMDKVLSPEMGDVAAMLGMSGDKVSTFAKQFMQHNPQLAKRLTPEMMKNTNMYETVEQAKKDDILTLNKFRFTALNKENRHYPFLSIYNEKLPKGESKFQLYAYMEDENGESMYIRIPVLGQFGMSEYSMGDEGNISLVNQPNYVYPMNTTPIPIESEEVEDPVTSRFDIADGDLNKTVSKIAQMNTPIGKLAKTLLDMGLVSPEVAITIKQLDGKNGEFDRAFNMINISSEMLADGAVDDNFVATVIIRELVHSITDREILQYAATNLQRGEEFRIVENAPTHIKKLFALFKETQRHLRENKHLDRYLSNGFTAETNEEANEVYNITYGGKNILEFVERMLTSPDFQQEMNKVNFKESDKTITQKFFEWLSSMFSELANSLGIKNLDADSVTANALDTIFTILGEKGAEYASNRNAAEAAAREAANEANDTLDDLGDAVSPDIQDDKFAFDDEPLQRYDFDKKGIVDDEFFGLDQKIAAKMHTSIANMIDSGILKVKC